MINIENVNYTYEAGSEPALKNINLHVNKGECILLCGKSGCGKSSVIRLINGMIPNFYEGSMEGSVEINGMDTDGMAMYELAGITGTVFQNPRTQFYTVNTTSEIAFGLENMGVSRKEIIKKVSDTANDLGIEYLMDRSIFELSGGEKQIIAFASVYAMDPDIYVLDEPSANLDFDAIERMRKILVLLKKQGKTIIIAEHRIFYLKNLMDRAVYMSEGQIVREYTKDELENLTLEEHECTGIRSLTLENYTPIKKDFSYAHTQSLYFTYLDGYYGKTKAISIDHSYFRSGKINAIIGHNGAGKSTFMSAITGILKKTNGYEMLENEVLSNRKRIKKSYIVMQEVNHQLFSDSVEEEVVLGAPDENNKDKLNRLLEELDIEKVRTRHPMTLSGGQKQRVIIASARFSGKQILIFDEPTSGLDYAHMQKTIDLLNEIRDEKTFIFVVTHDYEFIMSACDTVTHLEKGSLLEQYDLNEDGIKKLQNWFFKSSH